MLAKEIKVGGHYKTKISGRIVTVRVDAIHEETVYPSRRLVTFYKVTDIHTNKANEFRSAAKFFFAVTVLKYAATTT